MSGAIVAKRYAEALFQLGEEKNILDQLVEEFRTVKQVFNENNQLLTFLEHPRISYQEKKRFIDQSFQGLQTAVVNTIKLLIERHRIEITPSIIDHFIQLVNDAKGTAEVTVQSVRELTEQEKAGLQEELAKKFGKQTINITNTVNPAILGGLHIRIGNTIIDGTLSGKLKRIERNITSANN